MSVSFRGEECSLESALDLVFKELQSSLNNCHCDVRSFCMMEEQNESFKEICEKYAEVEDYILGMTNLFKELKAVCKQVRGPGVGPEQKLILKTITEKAKEATSRRDSVLRTAP
jgi:hypothetical protein